MDLRRLEYFLVLADNLHFGRSAARLGITQPALSQQVNRLEEEFGTALLERSSRAVALTPAGSAVIAPLRRCVSAYEEARFAARTAGGEHASRLRIGFPGSEVGLMLPPLLRKMSECLPDTRIEILETSCEHQAAELRRDGIDVGFMHLPVLDADVGAVAVRRDELVAILPRNHPSARSERVDIRGLAEEPFIDFRLRCPAYRLAFSRTVHKSGFTPRIEYASTQLSSTLDMVGSRLGVAIVPASTVPRTSQEVVARRLEPLGETLNVAFVWQVGKGAPYLRRLRHLAHEAGSVASRM